MKISLCEMKGQMSWPQINIFVCNLYIFHLTSMRVIVCINRPSILLLKIIIQCDIKLIRSFSIKKNKTVCFDGLVGWWLMVFNVTFNNISVISWRSVLLVEKTRSTQIKSPTCSMLLTNFIIYNIVSKAPRSNSQLIVVIGTDCTGSCKSNYHAIMTMTAPLFVLKALTYIITTITDHAIKLDVILIIMSDCIIWKATS
jgi:hypothetical protein